MTAAGPTTRRRVSPRKIEAGLTLELVRTVSILAELMVPPDRPDIVGARRDRGRDRERPAEDASKGADLR
jgi:hypothetical protein